MEEPTTRRPLDVCIVSYGRPDLLARCIGAVQIHMPEARIRVWDNRSGASPEIRRFADEHPEVDWTFSPDGRGYAAGANGLLARCSEDRDVLMLNPDAVLTGPLHGTRDALDDPGVAAASPTILDPTGEQPRWEPARRRLTMLRALAVRSGYADRLRGTPLSNLYEEPPTEVDGYMQGCCLMIARRAWRDIGPFDERYFLYGEDVDWQRRARERGWRLVMVDEPGVRHGGESVVSGRTSASTRAHDNFVANSAVVMGGGPNSGRWTVLTAVDVVLDRVQRSRRRIRRDRTLQTLARSVDHAVLITTNTLDRDGTARRRVELANELVERGHPVTLVCLQGLGPMQRELDDRVRLVLRPWWQPVVDLVGSRVVVVSGATNTEIAFAAGWSRLGIGRARRRWVVLADELAERPHLPRWARAVLRRTDRHLRSDVTPLHGDVVDGYRREMAGALACDR